MMNQQESNDFGEGSKEYYDDDDNVKIGRVRGSISVGKESAGRYVSMVPCF